jgi:hypothetical protein
MYLAGFECELLVNRLAHDIWLKLDFLHKIRMFIILLGGKKEKKTPPNQIFIYNMQVLGKNQTSKS